MITKYKIGNQIIDLTKLVAIGDLRGNVSGTLSLPLCFNFNSNVVAFFESGIDGLPKYHNNKGDWTEQHSDFFREAQKRVGEMIKVWGDIK